MRGALATPLLLTTVLFVAADNSDISQSSDDHDISKEPERYPYAGGATFYNNVDTDVSISEEKESPDLTSSHPKNGFVYNTECYSCTGCGEVNVLTPLKTCPVTSDISKKNKCIVYVEKYTNVDHPWVIRGCASERDSCAEMKQAYSYHSDTVKLVSCDECEGNRCNKSSLPRSLSFASIVFFVIIAPLITKYTLS